MKNLNTSDLTEAEIDAFMIAQALGDITFSDDSDSPDTDEEWSRAEADLHARTL
jgi:hypothetical protein|tara:strand:- start:161 stop:322 length:162 start_codon:yes stop_codon:yes gene_type:complete